MTALYHTLAVSYAVVALGSCECVLEYPRPFRKHLDTFSPNMLAFLGMLCCMFWPLAMALALLLRRVR